MANTAKHTVVIASILKPVDDVRTCEKMGCTLAASGLYSVHLVGSNGSTIAPAPNIHFHQLGVFGRFSWKRWSAPFRVIGILLKLRPELLIVGTHELAIAAICARIFMRTKIVYDVQENYYLNILHTNAFPFLLRWPLALYVRTKEVVSSVFFDLFILAEKVYERQLSFVGSKCIVIENKALIPPGFRRSPGPGIGLLFSGTLAESTGVFEAIRLAELLHDEDESVSLNIIGYCANSADRARLKYEATGKSYIMLTGIDEVQPHTSIVEAISKASFGIVCYPRSRHTEGAFPTKAFEYLACRLPVLATDQWAPLFEKYQAAVVYDGDTGATAILDKLRNGKFYSKAPEDVLWKDEEERLVKSLSQLLKRDPDHNEALT